MRLSTWPHRSRRSSRWPTSTSTTPRGPARHRSAEKRTRKSERCSNPHLTVQHPADPGVTSILLRVEKTLAGLDDRIQREVSKALGARGSGTASAPMPAADPSRAAGSGRQENSSSSPSQVRPGPRGGKRRPGRRPPQPTDNTCFNCGSTDGHWARNCPTLRRPTARSRRVLPPTRRGTTDALRPSTRRR